MPAELDRKARRFLATNLLRGSPRAAVREHLVTAGHDEGAVDAAMDELVASELFEAAQPFVEDARRLQHLTRRADALLRANPHGHRVRVVDVDATDELLAALAEGVPVHVPGAARSMPAFERWQWDALRARLAGVEVTVSCKPPRAERATSSFSPTRTVPFETLVDHARAHTSTEDDPGLYLVADNRALRGPLVSLLEDVVADPRLFDARPLADHAYLWLGPRGTHTTFHHDVRHVWMAQLRGEKRVRLAPPTDPVMMDGAESTVCRGSTEGAFLREVLLAEGDALLLPMGTWHEVVALTPSVTLSLTHLRGGDPPRFRLDGTV